MSRHVLGIAASGRLSSNSEKLLDSFLAGAEKAGNTVEKVKLSEQQLHFCTGCGQCQSNGACVFSDDAAAIGRQIQQADVIVFASPIYFYAISGQLKTLIDRMYPYYQTIRQKDFYYIFTGADSDPAAMDTAAAELRSFLSCLDDCHERGIIRGTDLADAGTAQDSVHCQEAFFMGTSV